MNKFIKKLGMSSCEQASRLISDSRERPLSAAERWKLRLHVAMCRYCARFARQVRLLGEAIQKDKQG